MQFLTRLPPLARQDHPFDLARSGAMLPLAGALIGALAGIVYCGARAFHLPAFIAATLAIASSAAVTGGLHEDGLADTADGFGGGRTAARKLEIMADSRIGTYGVLALIFATAIKIGCLETMAGARGFLVLVAAHALARSALPFFAYTLPTAKTGGLAVSAGRPHAVSPAIAVVFAIVIAAATLPAVTALACIAAVVVVTLAFRHAARRQIGGYTGDVLGAAEQLCEMAVLIAATVLT
jgi:adenosylcobinamide-GDP ribazoletransferase